MNKTTVLKITQIAFGIVVSFCILFLSLILSLRLDNYTPFFVSLIGLIPGTIIYFMILRKYALFSTGMIVGIFMFFASFLVMF